MSSDSHKLFHTPIWGFIISSEHYHASDYIDKLRSIQKTEPSESKSNFGGYQTRDTLETEGVFQELIKNHIVPISQNIIKDYCTGEAVVTEMWGNINDKYNYNQAHIHSGALSGVFYLQVPENSGKIVFVNPAPRSTGHLIRQNDYDVQPQNLLLLLFPSWLEHYVEQNMSDESRISLSFNIGVKNAIS